MEANNKAMREALAGLMDGICFHCDLSENCKGAPCEKMQKAKAALAKPPRNCDSFTDAESACRAWLDDEEVWDEFGSPKLKLHEWLLAPATDQKGQPDGE